MKTEWDKFYTKGVSPAKGMEVLHNTKWDTCYKGLREANTEEMRESLDNASALTRDEPEETKRRVQSAVIASYIEMRKMRKNSPQGQIPSSRKETRLMLCLRHRNVVKSKLTL